MKYYKIMNVYERHHGMQYQTGLNIDPIAFNPRGHCEPGGIYFARERILEFLNYGPYIREVTLPDDAQVYEDKLSGLVKYKADKVILRRKRIINSAFIIKLLDEGAEFPHSCIARKKIIDYGIRGKSIHLFRHPKVIKNCSFYWCEILDTKDPIFIKQMLRTFKPDKSNFDRINIFDYPKVIRRLVIKEVE